MGSHSLEEAEPCNDGDAALQRGSQDGVITAASCTMDVSLGCSPPCALPSLVSVDTPDGQGTQIPFEEAQKGKVTTQVMEIIEEPLLPDSATSMNMPSSEAVVTEFMNLPSTEAVVTDGSEPALTPSSAAFTESKTALTANVSVPADAAVALEGITKFFMDPLQERITAPLMEVITIDDITTITSTATKAAIVDADGALDSSSAVLITPSEISNVTGSPPHKDTDFVSVVTMDIPVVEAADSTAPVHTELTAPITTDSAIMEASSTDPISSSVGSFPMFSMAGIDPPPENVNQPDSKQDNENPPEVDSIQDVAGIDPPPEDVNQPDSKQDNEYPPEVDSIQVPAHWHSKPCVHISSIGGALIEEELLPLFSKYGPISSVSFENERHDAMLIRYDLHVENGEELLAEVREATNSTKLGEKTLIVEIFRPDSLLFVGNLTPTIDDKSLRAMFEPHGKIERAFVLQNAEGQSKGYGFVEYSLKSQAMTAKTVMGNINMDGRVLRVEWSDCKRIVDMLSTVLFIDRIPREGPHVEGSLKNLFRKYGRIRDSHLAIGTGNQIRGFGFIDFYHSQSADKAHQALDGHWFEGSNIRVSFANPSKSGQSYKLRYGAQGGQLSAGRGGSGGSGMPVHPPARGVSSRASMQKISTPMPYLPSRFMSPARPGRLGFGTGMQFERGPFDRGTVRPFHGSGRGMLGTNSFRAGRASFILGNMTPRAGMAVVEGKLPFGQGPVSINPSVIVQVATAQARAREEEAKARAEAARQGNSRSFTGNDSSSMNHHQRLQQPPHQKQGDFYMHQQAQQTSSQPQHQVWNQYSQQNMQVQRMPHHANQSFPQQQHMDQGTQNDAYYQQTTHTPAQQHGYISQYGQQQGYQYNQQAAQTYGQVAQPMGDQYHQTPQQSQAVYSQQNYGDPNTIQQQASQPSYNTSASSDESAGLDVAQQQAYAAYYQQQAQAQHQAQAHAHAATYPESGAAGTPQAVQQSYEAEWAAYYASLAAYQQQTSSTEAGQKRSADQMETNQAAHNYAGYPQQVNPAYAQQQSQPSNESAAYQEQHAAFAAANYQHQGAAGLVAYQQAGAVAYQQAGAAAMYAAIGQTGYEQSSTPAVDGGCQQPAAAFQAQTGVSNFGKRPRF